MNKLNGTSWEYRRGCDGKRMRRQEGGYPAQSSARGEMAGMSAISLVR